MQGQSLIVKKYFNTNNMPKGRPKKIISKESETVSVPKTPSVDKTQEAVKMLVNHIPNLFDQTPRGSISVKGVESLVEKIKEMLK